jgi:molecular chaperone Hsp33
VISVDIHLNPDHSVASAGGYLVQLLPGAEEFFVESLEKKPGMIFGMTKLLEEGMSLEEIAELLYDDVRMEKKQLLESFEILEKKEIQFKCNCSWERFRAGIQSLGKKELQKIFCEEKEEKLEVVCQFCKSKYYYRVRDFENILEEGK